MTKPVFKTVSLVLAMILLALAVSGCGGTAAEKVKVRIEIDGVRTDDNPNYYFIQKDFEVEKGTTAFDAVAKALESRQYTYTTDKSGMFLSFSGESNLKLPEDKKLTNGNTEVYSFVWKLNDEEKSAVNGRTESVSMKDVVVEDGNNIVIYIYGEEVTPAS